MPLSKAAMVLAVAALLAGCEARIGKEDPPAEAAATGNSAGGAGEGEAEDGRLSIDTPGLQMKLDIPSGLAGRAQFDSDSGVLYPGAALSGMHVEARDGRQGGRSMVELRFTSPDDVAKIAAWYRDPARAADFTVGQASKSGAAVILTGTEKKDGDPFDLSLTPRAGGGTEGRLRLRDKG
jgi:hypothetical protein